MAYAHERNRELAGHPCPTWVLPGKMLSFFSPSKGGIQKFDFTIYLGPYLVMRSLEYLTTSCSVFHL